MSSTTAVPVTSDPSVGRAPSRRLRRALVVGATVVALALGVFAFVLVHAFVAKPANDADAFRGSDGRPLTIVAGASTVQGTISADWVSGLDGRGTDVVNAGINGHTTADMLERLDRDVIELDPTRVIMLVGTNDIRGDVDPVVSRANVDALLDRLTSKTDADVAVMSLQPLGEQLDSQRNERVRAYNSMLAAEATSHGVDYLPLYESLAPIVADRQLDPPPFSFPIVKTAVDRFLLGRSFTEMSDARGLVVTADNVHLNERGAAVAQRLAGDWLAAR